MHLVFNYIAAGVHVYTIIRITDNRSGNVTGNSVDLSLVMPSVSNRPRTNTVLTPVDMDPAPLPHDRPPRNPSKVCSSSDDHRYQNLT